MYLKNLILTFPVYIIMYLITMFCIDRAQYEIKKFDIEYEIKSKYKFIFYSFFAILGPCILAGFRAETVGTDVTIYAKQMTKLASVTDSLFKYISEGQMEIGYLIMVYCTVKIFKKLAAVLFFTELMTVLPVYISAYKCRNKISMKLYLTCFFCIFYISTFNIMRQSIAAAYILLAFHELIDNKKICAIICFCIALLFHSTAIIGIMICIFGYLIYKIPNVFNKLVKFIIFVGIGFFLVNWKKLTQWAIEMGIVPISFSRYLNLFNNINSTEYFFQLNISSYIEFGFRIIIYLLPLILITRKKFLKKEENYINSIQAIILIGTIIYSILFVVFHSSYGYRISMYMEYFYMSWLGIFDSGTTKINLGYKIKTTKKDLILYAFLFIYWFVGYMYLGWHNTFPYKFSL